ncbi:MAG TPA: acylphosphatase [Beijerinckiaceae bacterium]|nr:acylphosphatase [Beijerinckiaceae bacterium]
MERRFVHVTFRGRVQGVGFRAFVERRAQERGLDGWVRNRRDGSVEAVLAGPASGVETVLNACREGPPGAVVETVECREEEAAGLVSSNRPSGFFVMPTV